MNKWYVVAEVEMTNKYAYWWEEVRKGPFSKQVQAELAAIFWPTRHIVRNVRVVEVAA